MLHAQDERYLFLYSQAAPRLQVNACMLFAVRTPFLHAVCRTSACKLIAAGQTSKLRCACRIEKRGVCKHLAIAVAVPERAIAIAVVLCLVVFVVCVIKCADCLCCLYVCASWM